MALLMLLSLRFDSQKSPEGNFGFTYVHESRYFLCSSLFLLLLATRLLQDKIYIPRLEIKLLPKRTVALAGMMVVNLLLFGRFVFVMAVEPAENRLPGWTTERKMVTRTIENLQQKNDMHVVVTASIKYHAYQPVDHKYAVIKDYEEVLHSGIKTSHPVQLLLITRQTPTKEEKKFIEQKGAKELYSGKRCRMFYLVTGNSNQIATL